MIEYDFVNRVLQEDNKRWDNWFCKDFPYSHKVVMLKKTGLFTDDQIETILKKSEWDDEIFYFIKALLIAKEGFLKEIGI